MVAEHGAEAVGTIFGLAPAVVSSAILLIAYVFIITERINPTITALLGACTMICLGVLNQEMAVEGIDFNTIFLLIGMMAIVGIMKESGVFQYVAILAAKSVRGNPRLLLIVLAWITAIFSGLLDNVTTVMLIVPITLLLTEQLKLPAYPFLFSQIFASNVGGTATLIGDPPNILIGSAVGFGFMDFVVNVGPPALVVMIFLTGFFDLLWGRSLKTTNKARAHLLRYDQNEALTDVPLLVKSLIVLALVLAGFILGHGRGLEPGTVALTGAALLMLLDCYPHKAAKQSKKVHKAFGEVEWDVIFFFIGLFIMVSAVERAGVLEMLAKEMLSMTGGNLPLTGMTILWVSTLVSTFVNNIPFVATIIPMIKSMSADLGGAEAIKPIWWCLSLGACLGGNGSLVGASANVMVASYADRAGQRIPFVKFLALAFPVMMMTVAVSAVYVWLVYFMM